MLPPENVNDVVDNIARILGNPGKRERAWQLRANLVTDLPKVWIDREQMKQVFMNLILNAIQAMKEGGSITYCDSCRLEKRSGTFR